MWAAYIADMKRLEISDRDVWALFINGQFNVQKSSIRFTAIGHDHAGEEVNHDVKARGGLKGITKKKIVEQVASWQHHI